MLSTIPGLHHVTSIASDPQRNLAFYTQVLGLRLDKLTVNFDDPGSYHFYFGDDAGTPGTLMTFFPWPNASRGKIGSGQATSTAFSIPVGSSDFWTARLREHRANVTGTAERFGEKVIAFEDPDGPNLELVESATNQIAGREAGPISQDHGIRGFHSVTLSLPNYERTAQLLTESMGLILVGTEGNRHRFIAPGNGPASVLDIDSTSGIPHGSQGAGTVHHIAWRTPDDASQEAWREQLVGLGFQVSPIMERFYFKSIYFREPGGVLFEIAIDTPGFAVDEAAEHLGERLMLPPQYESYRDQLEKALPKLDRVDLSRSEMWTN